MRIGGLSEVGGCLRMLKVGIKIREKNKVELSYMASSEERIRRERTGLFPEE